MNERAKEIFLDLKAKNKVLEDAFNEYVDSLTTSLEIPKEIAVTLVRDELVNRHEKDLILRQLFSDMTLKDVEL